MYKLLHCPAASYARGMLQGNISPHWPLCHPGGRLGPAACVGLPYGVGGQCLPTSECGSLMARAEV